MEASSALISAGILLVFIGFFLILAGVLLASTGGEGRVEGGGVIIIGPIPIIFGSSSRAALAAAIIGALLMVLSIIWLWLMRGGAH
ncbi:MAG: DUF131 domain-containing protein [Desulfurococcales archaeon]|nr:DUF131 domain-containing protein [Desulfurococcales archaeon]